MIFDDYVPAIILSHITIDHAEIKCVCVLTCVGCDFKCDISYVNGMAEIQDVCIGKKTSKTYAVIYE
jgi:hypothetical protein